MGVLLIRALLFGVKIKVPMILGNFRFVDYNSRLERQGLHPAHGLLPDIALPPWTAVQEPMNLSAMTHSNTGDASFPGWSWWDAFWFKGRGK